MRLPRRARVLAALQKNDRRLAVAGKSTAELPALRQRLLPQRSRFLRLLGGTVPPGVEVDTLPMLLPGRSLSIRRYTPAGPHPQPRPVVIDYHGGGFVIGSAALRDWFNGELARRTGAIIASVDYRLAPEHPFPAAYDDAVEAAAWVARTAPQWSADPLRMAVMGDSAGANLAAGVARSWAAGAAPAPLRAQVLAYGAFDLVTDYPSATRFADALFLDSAESEAMLGHYLQGHDRADVRVSPLFAADLSGAAPAFVINAEHDPLHDQSVAYQHALSDAGVETRYAAYPGTAHGFLSTPRLFPAALHALADTADFLRARLAAPHRTAAPAP